MYLVMLLLCTGLLGSAAHAQTPGQPVSSKEPLNRKTLDVSDYFSGYNGMFLLRDVKKGKTFVYNSDRAKTRLTPESTFKIPNALIGLQVKAVRDEYDVKRWDGVVREIDAWNRDHTLGSAMRESAVWYYQTMARDIGEERMTEWLQKISYGNRDISGGIDQFWLGSSLQISPLEQADFLEKLYKEELPFDKPVMKTVKRMMIQDEGDHFTLYGKTGSNAAGDLGWYVGFIETDKHAYVFVTNLNGTGADAKKITVEILKKSKMMAE